MCIVAICLSACRFSADDEAVMLANDTEYGLAAYFYTKDLRRAWHIAEKLEYGMVRPKPCQLD